MHAPPRAAKPQARSDPKSRRTDSDTLSARPLFRRQKGSALPFYSKKPGGAASHDREWRKEGKSWWPEEMPSETEMERCRRNLDAAGWKVDYVVTHEAPADLAGDLCWECNRPFEDDPLQNFLGEIDRRLDFKTWFFGHYHDDEWRDGRHRLIYRDIVPVGVRREDEDREPVG